MAFIMRILKARNDGLLGPNSLCQIDLRKTCFGASGINKLGHGGVDPRLLCEPSQFGTLSGIRSRMATALVVFFASDFALISVFRAYSIHG